jgi:hypothetical protein
VTSKEQINRICKSGSIASHLVGDTGGTKSPTAQHVEVAMESDFDRREGFKKSFLPLSSWGYSIQIRRS